MTKIAVVASVSRKRMLGQEQYFFENISIFENTSTKITFFGKIYGETLRTQDFVASSIKI